MHKLRGLRVECGFGIGCLPCHRGRPIARESPGKVVSQSANTPSYDQLKKKTSNDVEGPHGNLPGIS